VKKPNRIKPNVLAVM